LRVEKIALTKKLPNTSIVLSISSVGALILLVHLWGCKKKGNRNDEKNLPRLPHDQSQPG
jgi:hypothetical protein